MTRPTAARLAEIRARYDTETYGPIQDLYDLLAEVEALNKCLISMRLELHDAYMVEVKAVARPLVDRAEKAEAERDKLRAVLELAFAKRDHTAPEVTFEILREAL